MELCSAEPGCLSIDYVARPGKDHTVGDCTLFRTGGGNTPTTTCGTKTMGMAYVIDPPEEGAPDTAAVKRTTKCPHANGQIVCLVSLTILRDEFMLMNVIRQCCG